MEKSILVPLFFFFWFSDLKPGAGFKRITCTRADLKNGVFQPRQGDQNDQDGATFQPDLEERSVKNKGFR